MLTERGLVQRVFHSRDRHTLTLLLTFGVAVVLEDLLKIVFGANPVRVESPITGATEMVGLFFPNYRLFVMLFGGALIAAVWLLVFRTSLGAVVRAAAFDRHMSCIAGRAGGARVCRHICLRRGAGGLWPACCWRRSIRCSRPWAATSC